MRNYLRLPLITLLMCILLHTVGCIHYYPELVDGEEGRDPTKVSVAIQLELSPTLSFTKLLSRQQLDNLIYQRFVIEIMKAGSVIAHKEAFISVEEMQENTEIHSRLKYPFTQ